ncbi:MAG: hypothetical protein JST42_04640 [Bacteroidetes bacterium]|nr:hypothetical protein [Bacteroidota bacterium]
MLPLYRATAFNGIIDKGGRTKPWSILVDTGKGYRPFVVKVFSAKMVHESDSVTNEVLGYALAKQFDLPMPEAALIEMNMDFQLKIGDGQAQMALDDADKRLKFGTELIEGNYLFDPSLKSWQAAKMIETDTLFAFDNLIRNADRGSVRPNLLVKSKSAYLIDHEQAFQLDNNTIGEFEAGRWEDKFGRHHIFRNYLANARKAIKNEFFNSFEEYLRRMNVVGLNIYFQQLMREGYSAERHETIRVWLNHCKQNSTNFVALLKKLIT